MAAADLLQLIGTGLLNLATGESFYLAAVGLMGLTRAFTTVIGVYNLSTFVLAWIFLNESVTWDTALGAVFILLGVYLVSFYGHAVSPGLARSGRRFRARVVTTARPATPPPPSVTMSPTDGGVVRLPIVGRLPASFGLGIVLAIITGLIWGAGAVWLRSAADGFGRHGRGRRALTRRRQPPRPRRPDPRRVQRPPPRAQSSDDRRPCVSGILAFGVSSVLFIVALERVGAGQTVVLFSTAPLLRSHSGPFSSASASHCGSSPAPSSPSSASPSSPEPARRHRRSGENRTRKRAATSQASGRREGLQLHRSGRDRPQGLRGAGAGVGGDVGVGVGLSEADRTISCRVPRAPLRYPDPRPTRARVP